MNAIIVHSTSTKQRSLEIAKTIEGDLYQVEHVKKPFKSKLIQMFCYGYQTVTNKCVKIKPLQIDFNKYEEIYLVSPVWAGRINPYMKQFLKEHKIENKKVHIIASCDGGYEHYFETFEKVLDGSNEIIEEIIYVKGVKV